MFLKKKYERSEWYKGLLECEKLIQEGYQYHKDDGVHMWFKSKTLNDWSEELGLIHSYVAYKVNDPRCIGIMEYLSHREKYLK